MCFRCERKLMCLHVIVSHLLPATFNLGKSENAATITCVLNFSVMTTQVSVRLCYIRQKLRYQCVLIVVACAHVYVSHISTCICVICPLYQGIVTEAVRVKSFIRFVSYVCVLLHVCMYRYTCMGLRATEGPVSCLSRCAVGYNG